ncbi:flagellar biosynthetic protein FliR [Salinispira pacifica]|uniref:Flagellar biosynthesis protein FliR n=1 Tax=Salinispira pacifica TaxID=1307761 RepID=V5WGC6_9SPIO|nr:flagellar biosynthetic protein FliR [Salinispira pacifica]AHC14599.1 Flagellar biosynthesis protein FliR [Salinispira pacifica]
MFWNELGPQAAVFFLIFARVFALLSVAPLFSSSSLPGMARVGLTLLTSVLILPWINVAEITSLQQEVVDFSAMGLPAADAAVADFGLKYVFLLIGEAFIGILQGFILNLITMAFQSAGQFFTMQMGFGASAVFDPMAQEQIPLMGQFFNLVAMLVFLIINGFQKLFFTGILVSFQAVRAADLIRAQGVFMEVFIGSMAVLFRQAMSMAFPIFGTLFLVQVTMGLLAKAAPQMNLLMLGFPLAILVTFTILLFVIPVLMNTFGAVFDNGFNVIESLLMQLRGSPI